MSQLYVTLTNEFDKTFVFAFYNSFLKLALSCYKEKMFKYILKSDY